MYGDVGFGWIWFLWMGVAFLMFSSIGYWSYACRAHHPHHRFGGIPKGGFDLLDERYARAEIAADAYGRAKSGISSSRRRG